jgi:hypothetical protein
MSAAVEHHPGSRVLSVVAVTIGVCGLALSMWMNWRFGWSQANVSADRAAIAAQHMLSDPAAAVLTAIGGRFIAKERWGPGAGAIVFALGFIAWSMVGVNGFMSTRIAISDGHKAAVKVQEDYLKWTQGQTVNFDRPKSERQAMVAEVRDATKKLAEAAADIPDAQAASLGEMFGIPPERVQRILVTISSGMAQSIKFACMFFGMFAWPNKQSSASSETSSVRSPAGGSSSGNSRFSGEVRAGEQEKVIKLPTVPRTAPEPVVASQPNFGSSESSGACSATGSGSSAASSDSSSPASSAPASSVGISKLSGQPNIEVRSPNLVVRQQVVRPNFKGRSAQSEALADLLRLAREGPIEAQRQLCERWNRPKSVVSEWLSAWEADGYIVRRREGNQKSISIAKFAASEAAVASLH